MPSLTDIFHMPVHQDANPLDVEKTIEIQAKMNYKDHAIYRVIGAVSLVAFLIGPYYAAPKFLDQMAAKFESRTISTNLADVYRSTKLVHSLFPLNRVYSLPILEPCLHGYLQVKPSFL